ncbi:purine-nucleoside phosphorylase [Ascidiimonas sp. W6]|uniref:purine-nucleoside phosphorylase n=1 Tax=Ascidiimonas meishanensis TaxID=3128903 RepID=UPI0030EE6044
MSLHIEAKKGEIAETVLMPGDPLRAKWIAESYLTNVNCYNKVRGMLGFTGMYKGKRISVQGSGMGVASAMIYYHELFQDYNVKNIIRVGSAGSYQLDVKLRDIVIAIAASTTSNFNNLRFNQANFAPAADFGLLMKAANFAKENHIPIKAGNILTADEFYPDNLEDYKLWAAYGILCVEMETAGLYTVAAKYKAQALSILTISDSLVTGEKTTSKERETTFKEMIEIALNIV